MGLEVSDNTLGYGAEAAVRSAPDHWGRGVEHRLALISSAFPLPAKWDAVMHGLDRSSNPSLPQRAADGPGPVQSPATLFLHLDGARTGTPMYTVTADSHLDDILC